MEGLSLLKEPMNNDILVYGDDPKLLTTRRMVLEQAGYRVHTTMEFADAMLRISSRQVSVLLLCQSQHLEQDGAMGSCSSLQEDIRFVILSFAGKDLPVGYAEVVEGIDGPSNLPEAINAMLASHAVPQSSFIN
jgi:CheY-like chemotaxis protein